VNTFPYKATFPTPVIPTVIDGGGIFGLDPVLHVIYVLVAA